MEESSNQKSQTSINIVSSKLWYVYIVRCSDNSLYCGITTDTSRRVLAHNTSKKGSKYTRARRPVHLVWSTSASCRSSASKLEYKIKKLTKLNKEDLVEGNININDFENTSRS